MTCPHHWLIERHRENTSKGVCKLCGETKEFSNVYTPFPPRKKARKK